MNDFIKFCLRVLRFLATLLTIMSPSFLTLFLIFSTDNGWFILVMFLMIPSAYVGKTMIDKGVI